MISISGVASISAAQIVSLEDKSNISSVCKIFWKRTSGWLCVTTQEPHLRKDKIYNKQIQAAPRAPLCLFHCGLEDSKWTHKLSLFSAKFLFILFSTGVSWTKQWHNTALQFLSLGTTD